MTHPSSLPTDAEVEEFMERRHTKVPEPDSVRKARLDQEIAQRSAMVDLIAVEVQSLRMGLEAAGWSLRHSDLELTSPGDYTYKVQVTYTGGEFVAAITGLMGSKVRTEFRVTEALHQRQPDCVARLTNVLIAVGRSTNYTIHLDQGGTTLGLESDGVLFGECSSAAPDGYWDSGNVIGPDEDDGPLPDPADRPDMSGSPGHGDR